MNMRIPVRISYSENVEDQRMLIKVGGRIVLPSGKPPQFAFDSQLQYQEYLRMKRKTPTAATEDV